jgi:4-diphosphocytidyl-2-C-methyl-D-erythritol kinase
LIERSSLRLKCPAKVNLFLAVGPPDLRGYHPLRTVFQAVNLCDDLVVEFGDGKAETIVEVAGAELPEDNTITKTLRLSREVFSRRPSRVEVHKGIPIQSGLGGGSSDAAGVLRALAHAQGRPIDAEVISIASAVGADVPFFLIGGRARGEGYGDIVTPLPDPLEDWYVIAKPEAGCSTVDMYKKLDASPRDWLGWPAGDPLYNDFERVAPSECLDLLHQLLTLGARDAALSGSGSAVFGRFADRGSAESAADVIGGWAVRTLSRTESLAVEILA